MAFEKVKRNQYFDPPTEFPHSSRNHAEDMEEFHLPLERMHHANLHDRGIARGLEVSGTIGGTEIVVNPGVAIDGEGRLIVLATEGFGDIGVNPPGGDNEEVDVPVPLTTSSHADQTVYVTIQFSEILRIEEGSGGRREQVPWLRLQPVADSEAFVDDGTSIVLAIAVIDADGNLSQLKNQDGALPFRRRLIGETTEELRIRRTDKVDDKVQEVAAGKIRPKAGGGLEVIVPNSGDGITLAKEGGGNFANLEMSADTVKVKDATGNDTLKMDADQGMLILGGDEQKGHLIVKNTEGRNTLELDGLTGSLSCGTQGQTGKLTVKDDNDQATLAFDGSTALLTIGSDDKGGILVVKDASGREVMRFSSNDGDLRVGNTTNPVSLSLRGPDGNQESSVLAFEDDGGAAQRWYRFVNDTENNCLKISSAEIDPIASFMRLNGNVGIGTKEPQARLDIRGRLVLEEGSHPVIYGGTGNKELNRYLNLLNSPDNQSALGLKTGGVLVSDTYAFANPGKNDLIVKGNVGIGTASPQTKLEVTGGSAKFDTANGVAPVIISRHLKSPSSKSEELRIGVGDGVTTMHYINDESRNRIEFRMQNTDTERGGGRRRNDNIVMTIFGDSNGGGISVGGFAKKPGGGSWASTSDRRLKKEIKPLTGALNKLLELNGFSFKWKEPEKNGDLNGPQLGMVAQEVEKIFPDWVGVDSDGYKYLSIRGFEALTVEGFRELKSEMQTKVSELATRIIALEEKLKKDQHYESAIDTTS